MQFTLKFLKELSLYETVQPYKLHGYPDLSEDKQTNCEFVEVNNIWAEDVRLSQNDCRLGNEGFEFFEAPSRYLLNSEAFETDTVQANDLVQHYIEETIELVKERLAAELVVAIDWRFRRNASEAYPFRLEAGDIRKQAISVATTVHCDFSTLGGEQRIQQHLTASEQRQIADGNVRPMIINVWRPLKTVHNAPLLLADRRSVQRDCVIESDQVMTDKVNKTAFVFHRPEHKWYWLSKQTKDEVIMFATWLPESASDCADTAPHGAAYLYSSNADSPPRESVEVRMIAFR